ncbi:MAG: hypothetical protein ACI9TY_000828 [Alphaproteobacteria bacterium]|jgi:hypothetical protein
MKATNPNITPRRLVISTIMALIVTFVLYYVWWARYTNEENSVLTLYTSYPSQVFNWNDLEKRTAEQGLPEYALAKTEKAKGLPLNKQHEVLMTAFIEVEYAETSKAMTPMELIEDNKGDCNDFAYLWYHQLRALGVAAKVLFVTVIDPADKQGKRFGHAVTLTKNAKGEDVVLNISTPIFAASFERFKKNYQVIFLYEGDESGLSISDL